MAIVPRDIRLTRLATPDATSGDQMTTRCSHILSRLAMHGLSQQWADENEAAVLSGYSPEKFRQKVNTLEAQGFPPINPLNGKRPVQAILAFWSLIPVAGEQPTMQPPVDEATLEKWDERPAKSRRRTS